MVFADLGEGSGKVAINKVMGGIAEALVATGVGLFVAIPAVVAFNIFQKKINEIEDNVASISKRLVAFVSIGKPREDPLAPSGKVSVFKAAESVRNLAEIAGDDDDDEAKKVRAADGKSAISAAVKD